jgi:uncharacterized protein (TIGR02145 family)/uncharacterized repeat protein (TIGR02543 family)
MVLRFFFLGLAFFFMSCTDVERDSPYDPESINYRGGSSSSSVAIYAVTYNAGIGVTGVTVPANQTKTYDVALILSSAVPVRTGYTFAGWNILANGSGTSYKSGDSYTANTGVTLYAQWYQAGPSVSYGGETYKTVVIGSQTWMARNLNYNVEGSKCYENKESYCDTYGRLYDWYAAIAVCPEGWHLPSDDEWGALIQYVNPSCSLTNDCANAGTKLKSASGWNIGGNGTDYYGFAALPGGHGNSDGFSNVGYFGSWWSATEDDAGYYAYLRDMSYYEVVYRSHYGKYGLSSVRCLQDNSSVATYTVTYNAGTGVTGVTVPANQTKTHDAALTLSTAVPTRTGYTFAGWNTSSNGSGMSYASGASYVDNAGVTLYAQWTANTYTITYNANNGTGAPGNQTKTHDITLTLSSTVPTRTGYVFAGWNTSSNGSGTSYASGASYTANAGVTLYAQWTANTYTVTYNANNGTGAPANQTKTHDVALTLSAAVPARTGYAFAGWNTSSNGSGTSYVSGASYTANAGVTLYAQWTANTYTVTYNANNGTGAPSNQTKTHDVALTLSAAVPTRTSYAFAGWNTSANGSGTSYSSGASYTANAVVTLYAQWSSTVVSNCDGQTFRTVAIGTQTWMAENLNCNVEGSKCYSNNESNCATYGRLYNWATAMALPSSCTSSSCASQIGAKHRGICPTGWHIPSNADWDKLVRYVDGTNGTSSPYDSPTAGRYLKATSGWNSCGPPGSGSSYLCEDSHGFAALPGSYGYSDGSFSNVGIDGVWWSSSENGAYYAYGLGMSYNYEYVSWYSSNKSNLFSVRCLQD